MKDAGAAKKIVAIVGSGFGGLSAAKALARVKGVEVVLIDRRNHHLFQPLLYQVATAGLNPSDIAVPIRGEFPGTANVDIVLGEVESVDLAAQKLRYGGTVLTYDYLILACGVQHSYFGRPDWESAAPGLKTVEQATEIRRRILTAFEQAENTTDPAEREALLTFAIAGGGPTGVELAGAVAEISHTVLDRDFRHIDPHKTRVLLVEAGPRLLPMFSPKSSEQAAKDLKQIGVEVRTGARVTAVDAAGVTIGTERVSARTVLWAAGVAAAPLNEQISTEKAKDGRLVAGADLALPGHPNAFVIGDQASVKGADGKPLPGLAPVALQQGRWVARNIRRDLAGEARRPFRYVDKGQMATIGKRRAVLEFRQLRGKGLIAWLGWLVIHLFFLIGFRNRVAVMGEWIWSYVFSKRGARLITTANWRFYGGGPPTGPPKAG